MAVQKELWERTIVNNLFPGNDHLIHCKREDEYVLNGALVHIPQAGAKPTVVKNRNSFPAVAVRRADGDIIYVLDTYTTDPIHIPEAEKYEESPDKMLSILEDHIAGLRSSVGEELIYNWLAGFASGGVGNPSLAITAASVLNTTGAAVGAHLPVASGNRKLFTKEDLKRAQTLMNKQDIPKEDRYALLSSELLGQLQDDPDLKKRDVGMELDMKNGVIAKLYGFQILERSYTATYNGSNVIKAIGAAGATTDRDVAMCWHKNSVALSLGTTMFFESIGEATYYGDVYSALLRAGGRKRRAGAAGIVAIVQDSAA